MPTWSRFKRIIRACPHHEYEKNQLNTFYYNGLNDSTKALLDSVVGGQLSKVPRNQVKAKIKVVAKYIAWDERGVMDDLRGMIDTSNLDSIGANVETIGAPIMMHHSLGVQSLSMWQLWSMEGVIKKGHRS